MNITINAKVFRGFRCTVLDFSSYLEVKQPMTCEFKTRSIQWNSMFQEGEAMLLWRTWNQQQQLNDQDLEAAAAAFSLTKGCEKSSRRKYPKLSLIFLLGSDWKMILKFKLFSASKVGNAAASANGWGERTQFVTNPCMMMAVQSSRLWKWSYYTSTSVSFSRRLSVFWIQYQKNFVRIKVCTIHTVQYCTFA